MTEMVERVAEAIHAERCKVAAPCPPWEEASVPLKATARCLARAALKAVREPTEAMEQAADDLFHAIMKAETERSTARYGKPAYASAAFSLPLYRAMIEAALRAT